MYAYHLSNEKRDIILPLALQKGYVPSDSLGEQYEREINFLLQAPTSEQKQKMIDAGFKRWASDKTYVHRVDLESLPADSVKYISVTSTPEQREYASKEWNKFYSKAKSLEGDLFRKAKESYLKKRNRYLSKLYGKQGQMSIEELSKHPMLNEWSDLDKHLEENLIHGNRDQYASNIPHIQIGVTKGIVPDKVWEI